MQFFLQPLFSTLASNEFFQDLEFLFVTCLDSLRVVKDITRMIGEHQRVVDAVLAPLASCLETIEDKYRCY
jgi:ubiquinone/menaquinone biosynthesis C-methylase UbiE